MQNLKTTVAIVGAGPTGLLLAGDLAQAGVDVTVLERRGTESNLTRAFGVHARTLEHLDARGLADEVVAGGRPVDGCASSTTCGSTCPACRPGSRSC